MISETERWRRKHPGLVKNFPGENPRLTRSWARFRQADPKLFKVFRNKKSKNGKVMIVYGMKPSGKWTVQSIAIRRSTL